MKKNRMKNESENLQVFIYAFSEQIFYITRKPNLTLKNKLLDEFNWFNTKNKEIRKDSFFESEVLFRNISMIALAKKKMY